MPVRRVKSPRCIRNPFLTGGGDVHDHNFDTRIPRADGFPFSRLHMEFKVQRRLSPVEMTQLGGELLSGNYLAAPCVQSVRLGGWWHNSGADAALFP